MSRLRSTRTAAGAFMLLALAACGKEQDLRPAPGYALPQQPATAPAQPTANALLTSPQPFRPGRSDEVLTKSTPRADDRFDLPPR